MKRFVIIFIVILQSVTLLASDHYRVYDVRSGLSENSILDIYQDEDGYMWFATKDGLNRFNGYTFDVFRKNIDGVNLKIDDLLPHKDGKGIWVGSDYKLLLFNPIEETFSVDSTLDAICGVQSLSYDDNNLWIASESGIYRWDMTSPPVRYKFDDIHEDAVARVLLHDSNGNIWLGLGAGLYRYIKETDTFIYL